MGPSIWTDAVIARLKVLHSEDQPFSVIASKLSSDFRISVSRNAAIGKAMRLGLTVRKYQPNTVVTPRRPRKRRPLAYQIPRRQTLLDQAEQLAEAVRLPPDQSPCAVSLMQLGRHHCRWPINAPDGGLMMYCGAGTLEGGSYCPRHHRISYHNPVRISADERGRRAAQARKQWVGHATVL